MYSLLFKSHKLLTTTHFYGCQVINFLRSPDYFNCISIIVLMHIMLVLLDGGTTKCHGGSDIK